MVYQLYRRALSLQELEDIINDPNFIETEHVDIIVLPLDPDTLTDEDEGDDNDLGTAIVNDVPRERVI